MSRKFSKILITGQSGILGSDLIPRLDGQYEIAAVSRHPRDIPHLKSTSNHSMNITHLNDLQKFLVNSKFDAVINCAAMTDVDRCEINRDEARKVNAEVVGLLANYCSKTDALLVHISTDYLFDGKDGPYPEDAAPKPLNYYGMTKLQAEERIQSSGCNYAIVRTSFLYGRGGDGGSRVVRWILESFRQKKEIKVAEDQFSNPTYSVNLADAIAELLKIDYRGVINVAGADYISRYDFTLLAAEIFGLDKGLLKRTPFNQAGLAASRPLRAGLKVDLMKKTLKTKPLSVKAGLEDLRQSLDRAHISQSGR